MNRIEAVIFDLDQTLIDSRTAAPYRLRRMWQQVYQMIDKLRPYDGIPEMLSMLKSKGVVMAIVTTTPRPYCQRVLSRWGLSSYFADIVAYHDTQRHKPDPDPILLSLKRLNLRPSSVVAVGDTPDDIRSARAARVGSVGALWGAAQPDLVKRECPDVLAQTVQELHQWFDSHL
jgi:HAD superfamily hydrolase (TIGR01509 family)